MPRVPQEEIERLKSEVSVQALAEARGIVLKPHGQNLLGLCPFHEDHDPSLVITPEKNLWNCLGACGGGGSVIDWVMKSENVSFRHAVEILRERSFSSGPIKPMKSTRVRGKLPSPVDFDADEQELFHQVIDYYHRTLKETVEGLGYLEWRGLKNSEMIDHFKIGYSNRTLGLRLPEKNRQAGATIRTKLMSMGIIRETSGHEHFRGSVVFPIYDEYGKVTGMYGRKTAKEHHSSIQYHTYLPGPHKGLFNVQGLQASKDVILCEAIIDALTFWCAGFRNVTASYGVNGFTPDHLAAFRKYGIERVFIAYDRDAAGEKAAEALAEKLIGEGFECFRVMCPKDMDANEYALKVKPPEKSLDLAIRNAVWMGKAKSGPDRGGVTGEPAAKKENVSAEEPPTPETPVQSAKEDEGIFPLAAGIPPVVEEPAPPAPLPRPPAPEPIVEMKTEEIIITLDTRRWRVRGLSKNTSFESIKSDLGKVLQKLEEIQEKQIRDALAPKEPEIVLTDQERAEALELLKDPRLLDRILSDFERCSIVGEETNKLVAYLAAVSRKLGIPLAVIIQSISKVNRSCRKLAAQRVLYTSNRWSMRMLDAFCPSLRIRSILQLPLRLIAGHHTMGLSHSVTITLQRRVLADTRHLNSSPKSSGQFQT
jgi:DNA primase